MARAAECHTRIEKHCAGLAIFRSNVCKVLRDPKAFKLPVDYVAVFATTRDFEEHHGD